MRLAVSVLLVVATACVPTRANTRPDIGGVPGDGGRVMPAGISAPRSELTSKKVNGKEDPNVLLAADRTRCTVSADKYREISLGESVLCAWTK